MGNGRWPGKICEQCGEEFIGLNKQQKYCSCSCASFAREAPIKLTPLDRLWTKLDRSNLDGCWPWTGYVSPNGYARSKRGPVHRLAYELHYGPIPEGMHVCHTCDNRICCNFSHLFLGTHQDNMADKKAKGRHSFGERNGMAKLTETDVLTIRASGKPPIEVAKQYNISSTQAKKILNKESWSHL